VIPIVRAFRRPVAAGARPPFSQLSESRRIRISTAARRKWRRNREIVGRVMAEPGPVEMADD
jgi:hypothetical protein